MSRSTPEWIGKTDDARIPPRVMDEVARKANDCCQKCGRAVGGKLRAEIDHVIPLIINGQHRQSNLQLLCHECHGAKTALDVKLKSKIAKGRKKRMGFVHKRSEIKSPGFPVRAPKRPIGEVNLWRGLTRQQRAE
jgi:5-methylcytosine-specific restriction protein A